MRTVIKVVSFLLFAAVGTVSVDRWAQWQAQRIDPMRDTGSPLSATRLERLWPPPNASEDGLDWIAAPPRFVLHHTVFGASRTELRFGDDNGWLFVSLRSGVPWPSRLGRRVGTPVTEITTHGVAVVDVPGTVLGKVEVPTRFMVAGAIANGVVWGGAAWGGVYGVAVVARRRRRSNAR